LSSSIEASRQAHFEALPSPVLVLRLGRSVKDVAADGIAKISKPVQFAPELEIPLGMIFSFVSTVPARPRISHGSVGPEIMAPISGEYAEPVHYKLYRVLRHHSESAGSGHYAVDALHPDGESGSAEARLHIDDEAVSVVRHDDVFDNERVDDECVYMLFYCRTAPSQT
jgi:ubiquitin carboxyl-terminal hydrolase 10